MIVQYTWTGVCIEGVILPRRVLGYYENLCRVQAEDTKISGAVIGTIEVNQ